ncbi:MAG: formylglycine-generating enzyme family protein [Pseudomonadales bacterium]|nr:formylglycine-generating enzyme family protein [Pseudomonadales bacterium]
MNIKVQMISILGGEITLRDDRKKTTWSESIKPFELSKTLITQTQYLQVTSKTPSTFTGDNKPVESVSWFDAIMFCNTLSQIENLQPCYLIQPESQNITLIELTNGYRLPTDAQWEYACRANSNAVQYADINDIAFYEKNSKNTTHDVALKAPNDFGLFDMLGNVWEWCWDLYDPQVYGSYRIFRGGGFSDQSRGCLASNRRRSHPTFKVDDLGFRVAKMKN